MEVAEDRIIPFAYDAGFDMSEARDLYGEWATGGAAGGNSANLPGFAPRNASSFRNKYSKCAKAARKQEGVTRRA